jgi:hypothetical protein
MITYTTPSPSQRHFTRASDASVSFEYILIPYTRELMPNVSTVHSVALAACTDTLPPKSAADVISIHRLTAPLHNGIYQWIKPISRLFPRQTLRFTHGLVVTILWDPALRIPYRPHTSALKLLPTFTIYIDPGQCFHLPLTITPTRCPALTHPHAQRIPTMDDLSPSLSSPAVRTEAFPLLNYWSLCHSGLDQKLASKRCLPAHRG